MIRCEWARNELEVAYHDIEWGVPVHDDRRHFEFLILDGAQAGLSWSTILAKRSAYQRAFCQFDAAQVAKFGEKDVERLMQDAGIVRNRLKIESAIRNARAFLEVQSLHGSFDAFVWRFVGGSTIINEWRSLREIPAVTPEAEAMSKDLKRFGFNFVGPTICYAYMQAAGLVDDHTLDCFRKKELANLRS